MRRPWRESRAPRRAPPPEPGGSGGHCNVGAALVGCFSALAFASCQHGIVLSPRRPPVAVQPLHDPHPCQGPGVTGAPTFWRRFPLEAYRHDRADPGLHHPPLDARAGVRPWRENDYRLEGRQSTSNPRKYIVHNYGHGGAGITLSWGVASQVRDLIRARAAASRTIPRLPSGLRRHGPDGGDADPRARPGGDGLRGVGEDDLQHRRRPVGASWVIYADEAKFKDVLKTAYTRFAGDVGNGFGVSKKSNYTPGRKSLSGSGRRSGAGPDPGAGADAPSLRAPGSYNTVPRRC